jgi:DNA adenine methylase
MNSNKVYIDVKIKRRLRVKTMDATLNDIKTSNTELQPLLKWPGGKSTEFEYIRNIIPPFKRYIEPFVGGGAVFFKLNPQKAVINDVADELIDFYSFIKGDLNRREFEKEILGYVNAWDKIPSYIEFLESKIARLYRSYFEEKISKKEFEDEVSVLLKIHENDFRSLFKKEFCIDENNLIRQIKKNLFDKLIRTVEVEKKIPGGFGYGDLEKNIETGFKSGFYMHFRDLLNNPNKKYKISHAKHVANWYFIREYCYGSMFRFNSKGEFNIPYGGMGYNGKNFRKKIEYLLSKNVEDLLDKTDIYKLDFADLMKKLTLTKDDFIFLDPPYDTDFSSYEGNVFDKNDQTRLADIIIGLPAKWIMIIKDTDFISSLYRNKKGIVVESFEKSYLYNVKGRNDRDVSHLIIRNF